MEETIESFLDFLSTVKKFSPNTIAAYRNDLSQLATFVAERGSQPKWTAFNRELMLSYVLAIKEKMYAPATVARKVAAIKTFSEFLVNKGILERDATKDIGGPQGGEILTPNGLQSRDRGAAQAADGNLGGATRSSYAAAPLRYWNAGQRVGVAECRRYKL